MEKGNHDRWQRLKYMNVDLSSQREESTSTYNGLLTL
jgi:hypothetical protein